MAKRRRKRALPPRARQVFLNIPYSRSYERLMVALTTAVIVTEAEPMLTFKLVEVGEGRLRRIMQALESSQISIHDLSYGHCRPARFNMPFELGLAYAERYRTGDHEVHVLEARPYRLQRTLSDLNGIDPKIHHRKPARAIHAVLGITRRPDGNPSTARVLALFERVWRKLVPQLREDFSEDLFEREIYEELCVGIRLEAFLAGLI
jgi:hypothetical protein